ncbi:MAG: hypothetical protein JNJ78_01100 [Anaerolineae bacterium]|nr:hypothetical protein [Anaerolineae bacterium]
MFERGGRMGFRPWIVLGLMLMMVACSPERVALNNGPLLVQDITLAPTTPAPTRYLSPTPSPVIIPVSTIELSTSIPSFTQESDFVLVTPTLPPSKTPTHTATITPTSRPTLTPSPTPIIQATYMMTTPVSILPPGIVPIPTAVSASVPAQNCTIAWFFSSPIPATCPLSPPSDSAGAFQQYQSGVMIWVARQDAIYVLYDSVGNPRWQVMNDAFVDGMADTDPAFNNAPPFTWQPRRGFGLLWRNQVGVRDRIGWAMTEAEIPYTPQLQLGSDGTIFVSDPRGGVYGLAAGGGDWQRYGS